MKFKHNILIDLLLSAVYGIIFFLLYRHFKSPAHTFLSLLFISYVSWSQGMRYGAFLAALNWGITCLVFYTITPDFEKYYSPESLFSFVLQASLIVLLGYFGRLSKRLKKEIHSRKIAEAELKEYQVHLEEKVKARTRELQDANERLMQAEKMESIGQLAGGIAHDFNNYLTVIFGYTKIMIKKTDETSPFRKYARLISETAQTAAELTSKLLLFARKEEFRFEPLNVNDLVRNVVTLLTHAVKNISISCETAPGLPTIMGGNTQIQNALLNLAFNARDAMGEGGKITFKTEQILLTSDYCIRHRLECPPGPYLCISVADTGCGIPPEQTKHIFEPFYTTKEKGKGTGMGLATVYGIVKSHQGAITVETEPGKGTVFFLFFPVDNEGEDIDSDDGT